MADPVLKFPPEQKGAPSGRPTRKLAAEPRRRLMAGMRRYRRFLLLVVLPLAAAIGGLVFYLNGGRYVGTDDAYVGAQKVLITPDISGKIIKVVVKEGQNVKQGDELFEIDPEPFQLALNQAKAQLEQAKTTYENLVANVKIYGQMLDLAQQGIDLKQRDVDRKQALVNQKVGSQLDLDNSATGLVTAGAQAQFVKQNLSNAKAQLLGNPELPMAEFPPYAQAKAAARHGAAQSRPHRAARADGGRRDPGRADPARPLRHRRHAGVLGDRRRQSLGRRQSEGDATSPMSAKASRSRSKSMRSRTTCSRATIGSLSPGTGAQFAILPPQNATGNFVKVVQRVPVRIYFDKDDPFVKKLKAGMSVYATIDTGHKRSLAGLLGFSSASATKE